MVTTKSGNRSEVALGTNFYASSRNQIINVRLFTGGGSWAEIPHFFEDANIAEVIQFPLVPDKSKHKFSMKESIPIEGHWDFCWSRASDMSSQLVTAKHTQIQATMW